MLVEEKPVLVLEQGDNSVFFSVASQSAVPLRGLRTSVILDDVPAGIEVGPVAEGTDEGAISESTYRLTLPIHVDIGVSTRFELPIVLRDTEGHVWEFQVVAAVRRPAPAEHELRQNAPNPFNPNTIIQYTLVGHHPEQTRLEVYNSLGQRVRGSCG